MKDFKCFEYQKVRSYYLKFASKNNNTTLVKWISNYLEISFFSLKLFFLRFIP